MKKLLFLGGVLMLGLLGCGQKGALYLPQPAQPSPTADTPQTAPAPAESQSATGH